jgi:hypothetical protein
MSISKCIACAEEIKAEALICKHCGTEQSDSRFQRNNGKKPAKTSKKLDPGKRFLLVLAIVAVAVGAYVTNLPKSSAGHWVKHCIDVQVRNPFANPNALFRDPNNPLYYTQQQCAQKYVNR